MLRATLVFGPYFDGDSDKLSAKSLNPEFSLRVLSPYRGTTDDEFVQLLAGSRQAVPGNE